MTRLQQEIEAAQAALLAMEAAEAEAVAQLRLLGNPIDCRHCIHAPGTASVLKCVKHGLAIRAVNEAARRTDAARLAVLFSAARQERLRRIA